MFNQGYIGVSNNTRLRWNGHKSKAGNLHLQRAITKYGWENLEKDVVLVADEAYCLDVETKLRSRAGIGWNIAAGGGMPPHDNIWNKGRKIPKEELEALYIKGFGFKKGHINWNTGMVLTDAQKARQFNLANYMKGKPGPFAGKPMPRHVVEAARQANLGRVHSEESKRKRSLVLKGRVHQTVACTNCPKKGGATAMKRWHFDNCTGDKTFMARTTIAGKRIYLGNFATKDQVAMAIKKAHLGE